MNCILHKILGGMQHTTLRLGQKQYLKNAIKNRFFIKKINKNFVFFNKM